VDGQRMPIEGDKEFQTAKKYGTLLDVLEFKLNLLVFACLRNKSWLCCPKAQKRHICHSGKWRHKVLRLGAREHISTGSFVVGFKGFVKSGKEDF